MMQGIVGYRAEQQAQGVLLTRSYAGIIEICLAKDFDQAVDFLTVTYPNSLHVCWSLHDFKEALFSLLPAEALDKLKEGNSRVRIDPTKIFSIDKVLGITTRKLARGNFADELETNLYQLQHWLPDGTPEPDSVASLAELGESILDALENIDIYPNKLTSPIAVYTDNLDPDSLPTVYSFNLDWLEAVNYASRMMSYEWRSAYKLGYFDQVWVYDLQSAYPAIMASLPSTDGCYAQKSNTYIKADWGILKGKVEVTAKVSPLVYDTGDGYILPSGVWEGYFTNEEIAWLEKWGAGKFILEDGWFFKFGSKKPYKEIVNRLLTLRRTNNGMVADLAKKVGQGLSGKLDESHQDGNLGVYYNPILAAMTRSRCRLAVADFIYTNRLVDSLIAVQVDGVISDREATITEYGYPGSWRFEGISPALILSKGWIWRPGKQPQGIGFEEITEAMKAQPDQSVYVFNGGKRSVDLLLPPDDDRDYSDYPQTGREALTKHYSSQPLELAPDAPESKSSHTKAKGQGFLLGE